MQFYIDDMNCGGCAGNVVKIIHSVDPNAKVVTNVLTRSVEVTSSATRTRLEAALCRAGYPPRGGNDAPTVEGVSADAGTGTASGNDGHNPRPASQAHWWRTKKGRLVVGLGLLMGAAYLIALFVPDYGMWAFTAAVLVGVIPFARKAVALAKSGSPFSIETLMSVAALGALIIGEGEEAAAVVFLFSVGELLETVAAGHARAGISALASLVPKTAVLLDAQGGQREVPAASLRVDDLVLVRPGTRVPADGVIVQGMSSLDESPVTGESIPLEKSPGKRVFAGSINIEGALQIRVEKTAADNTIARVIHLVEHAQASKAPTARFIEQFSRYYTPAVMTIAALIISVPPLAMGGEWETWLYRGLALLLIACPCALVLSTPAAIASGLAAATRRGLLIKGGKALETLSRISAIAFDKTGTLTEGQPRVTDVVAFTPGRENEVLALAASVESGSSHPLAKAIVNHAEVADIRIPAASNAFATAGKAVHATVVDRALAIGSPAHAAQAATLSPAQHAQIESLQSDGKTVSVLFDEQSREALGLVALRDESREDAQEGVAQLKAMGVRPVMLTGDNRRTAQAIARHLGMDWAAELLPEDKLRLIDEMKHDAKVAMVGDGINDAPALATADVGIAMGGGTDVAIETADAALLKNRVTDVAHLLALSRATMANIRQNVTFALGLKGAFLITTALGFTGLWMAVLADTGATAIVTLNALRLLRFKGAKAADPVGGEIRTIRLSGLMRGR